MKNIYEYMPYGAVRYGGYVKYSIDFVKEKQLLDKELWIKFIEVFHTLEDGVDKGWRGEYWGKMMRGACHTYMYDNDKKLYDIIDFAVTELLKQQDEFGRFSTYNTQLEFHGWDVWSRKYVLTGLAHFYKICIDENKKQKVLSAMKKHTDYMLDRIGNDKLSIFETSDDWGGLNSSSILEPICELYNLTGEKKYLDFAEYILNLGGCKYGNLLDLAEQGNVMPFEYPEVKAYEMMSYFEGVLAYYEITGKVKYYDIVDKFVQALFLTDITIVGSCGCSHELFDNSVEKQSEFTNNLMQETCVTVTLMRLVSRLYMLKGEQKYADIIELSALNALYGTINENDLMQYSSPNKEYLKGLPFDSYSPLANSKRGMEIGGIRKFASGGHYGCCGSIASVGIAIYPLTSVLNSQDFIIVNNYLNGEITFDNIKFVINGSYLIDGKVNISLYAKEDKRVKIKLRIPCWAKSVKAQYNNKDLKCQDQIIFVDEIVKDGDKINLEFGVELKEIIVNGRTAFKYGALVLSQKIKEDYKFGQQIKLQRENGKIKYEIISANDTHIEVLLYLKDGKSIKLINYSDSGKDWLNKDTIVNVWFNVLE